MSISGINGGNYYSAIAQNRQTNPTGETAQKGQDEILSYYKGKYPTLNFLVGYNTKGKGSTGLGNVILHPNLLKKMVADPEFAQKAEENIKHIPKAEAWLRNMCSAGGMNLISSGCFVDEDGNIAGSWSYVETANGSNDKKAEEKTQTLDDFKREIYETINKMQVSPSQSKTQISINIADKAFEKMMKDPEYKNLMLKTIERDLNGAYPTLAAPSYSVISIGNDCEYRADAYGAAFGDVFKEASTKSFMQKNTKNSSSDYEEYSKRRRENNKEYQNIMDKSIAESRQREKSRIYEELAKDMQESKLKQIEHQKKALEAYGRSSER